MKHFYSLLALALLVFGAYVSAQAQMQEPEVRPGQLLVQPKAGQSFQAIFRDLTQQVGEPANLQIIRHVSEPMRVWQIGFDETVVPRKDMRQLFQMHPDVEVAQYNHVLRNRATVPNDPEYSSQWQYDNTGANGGVVDADIDAPEAWDFTTGGLTSLGDTIVVCVVDDGIDIDHPDMVDNLWVNHAEIPGNGIDDDNNGYTDDYLGWNAYNDDDNVGGGFAGGHGTPVAGIVGARGDNGIGVAGVNWEVEVMIVSGGGDEADAIAAYTYPLVMRRMYNQTGGSKGAFVVATNSSWGTDFGQPSDAPLWCAFYDSLGAEGIISCGATINGNEDVDVIGDLPTACPSKYLISVTNMGNDDVKITGAGYGLTTIDLGAFGEGTWTVESGGGYDGFGGTSGATPHVAGAVGLLYAAPCASFSAFAKTDPDSAAVIVIDAILDGVDPNTSLQNITVTGGRLNLHQSMLELLTFGCDSGGCFPAFGMSADNVTDEMAILNWSTLSSGMSILEYRPVGSMNTTTFNAINTSFLASGLAACTDYEWRVNAPCDSGMAGFTDWVTFRTDGCCESPGDFDATVVNDNSIDFAWDFVLAANTYNLRYRADGTTSWTVETGLTTQTFSVNSLDSCTTYEYQVQTVCDTGAAPYTESKFVMTSGCKGCLAPYCETEGGDSSDEWIEQVDLHTMSSVTGSDNGYGDYTGTTSVVLFLDSTYTVTVSPGYDGFSFNEDYAVFIDFDLNGDFAGISEQVLNDAGNQPVSATFTVPSNADTGITRMRVKMSFDDNLDPCEASYDFGEVEDYCIRLVDAAYIAPDGIADRPSLVARVFPNPSAGLFQVRLSGTSGGANLTVTGVLGNVLHTSRMVGNNGQLDLSGYASGLYFLQVEAGDRTVTQKLYVR